MKSKMIFVIATLLFLIITINTINNNKNSQESKPLEMEIGQEFTNIKYENPMYILNYKIIDIDNDEKNDMLIVVGEKSGDEANQLLNNIDVVIYNSTNNTFENCKLKKCSGIIPKVDAMDITGDGTLDIVLLIENSDRTKNIRILSKAGTEYKEIFKNKDNRGIVFTGNFNNGFSLNLICAKLKINQTINVSNKKENYIANKFYDTAGRITSDNQKIITSKFMNIEFVLVGNQYALQTTQYIYGFNESDIIDEITAIWKYENGKWNIKEAKGLNIGKLI